MIDAPVPYLFVDPCDSILAIDLVFEERPFPISSETFNLGPISEGSSQCIGGVVGSDSEEFVIVGDVFLQNVYSGKHLLNSYDDTMSTRLAVYDVGEQLVGFATLLEL